MLPASMGRLTGYSREVVGGAVENKEGGSTALVWAAEPDLVLLGECTGALSNGDACTAEGCSTALGRAEGLVGGAG